MISDKPILNLAEAMRFHELNPPVQGSKLYFVADLSEYTQATPEALAYLAQKTRDSCDCVNFGLTSLDKDQAGALINWEAMICFVNLERLDAEVAAVLVAGNQIIDFDNLKELNLEVAVELAKLNSILDLTLESISMDVANELIKHQHELCLTLMSPPTEQLLNVLSHHSGYRLHVTWERQAGSDPCQFSPSNSKKVFIVPHVHKESGKWFENVYIGDADFYPDELVSNDGIIEVL